ncbi:MAG: thiol-disulfide oxidoreductase DCC family protein [Bacteroidia bacterium]
MPEQADHTAIVLFDGICNFCDNSINRIIRHDKKNHFRFAALQSESGKKLSQQYGIDTSQTDSIILIEDGKAYTRSSAILRITKNMNRLYPLLYGLLVIPPFIRNAVYDLVARNRYKWFGKKESCMVPTAEVRNKFLD